MTQGNIKASGSVGLKTGILYNMSEFDLANRPYGETNNSMAETELLFTGLHETGRSVNFFNLSSLSIEASLSKKIGVPGPYIGIVLRIDSAETLGQESEIGEIDRILNNTDMETTSFAMRVRIPELHTHIPIPKTVVNTSMEDGDFDNLVNSSAPCRLRYKIDNAIMDMYPLISGYGQGSNLPQIGSYVRVDFANRSTMQGGFYIGPVSDRSAVYTTQLYDMGWSAFNNQAVNPEEKDLTKQPQGQFNTPTPSTETQVASPTPIKDPSWSDKAATEAPLGGTDF